MVLDLRIVFHSILIPYILILTRPRLGFSGSSLHKSVAGPFTDVRNSSTQYLEKELMKVDIFILHMN